MSQKTESLNDCRIAFEGWVNTEGPGDFSLEWERYGYIDTATQKGWLCWRAAWLLANPTPDRSTESRVFCDRCVEEIERANAGQSEISVNTPPREPNTPANTPVMGDASTRKDEASQGASSVAGQTSPTTWTCPDCCVNPCVCEIGPSSGESAPAKGPTSDRDIPNPSNSRGLESATHQPDESTLLGIIHELEAVLCDPEGHVCIAGSDGDRVVVQNALARMYDLAAELKREARQPNGLAITEAVDSCMDRVLNWDSSVKGYIPKSAVLTILSRRFFPLTSRAPERESLSPKVDELAKLIASNIGYDFDTLYANKREWTDDRGKRHDINVPYRSDFEDCAFDLLQHYDIRRKA